ncbi:MAG: SufBD protein [Synergistaceae bacterium]|nr:SufBD protein [Synergistota bacterium]NLM72157.1 SufBD protein [Synergistaceae bacterium]
MQDIQELITALLSKDAGFAYESLGRLEALSVSSNAVYEYFDEFLKMLEHESSYVRTRGFVMTVANARWDEDCKVDENIDRILKILRDPKPIAARQAIKRTPDLARCKPNLRADILRALEQALDTNYPESMQSLVRKDVSLAIDRINSLPPPRRTTPGLLKKSSSRGGTPRGKPLCS